MANSLKNTKWSVYATKGDFTSFIATFDANGTVTWEFENGGSGTGTWNENSKNTSFITLAQVNDRTDWAGVGKHNDGKGHGVFYILYDSDVAGVQISPFVMEEINIESKK